ncbi:hypothetical protein L7F22_045060 [Adiantum nelumboides]|nr:hypothetical protein [Adiantum nelumboides]
MEISTDYLSYLFGPCVNRLEVDLFVDLVDDVSEMEWLLRWSFIDLDLEIHQGDYRRYVAILHECLSDDEREDSLPKSDDSSEVSMMDLGIELDIIALIDGEEIDEGELLGLPRGLYRLLLPQEQGVPKRRDFCSLVGYYARRGDKHNARATFERMRGLGIEPTTYAFTSLLHAYTIARDMKGAVACFNQMMEEHIEPSIATYCMLISGFAKIGDTE